MKPLRFFYSFTKAQQKGIMALLVIIIFFQIAYCIYSSADFTSAAAKTQEEKEWLALQVQIDSLKSIKKIAKGTIYPFNPNYISDYKGYTLGLSVQEIDKLIAYRNTGRFINTPQDFKAVTGVHDTLLDKLTPYFKFSSKPAFIKTNTTDYDSFNKSSIREIKIKDINDALEEDLVKVYGIGPYYAKAILRRRDVLGAFVSMDQMNDFQELSDNVKAQLKKTFCIKEYPQVIKINVNTASLQQLSRFPYFNRDIARSIITKRSMDGKLKGIDDLLEIHGFSIDKVKIIALYLEF